MNITTIRLIIFAVLLTSLQGSILWLLSLGVMKLCGDKYHRMQLILLEWSAVAFLLPAAFFVVVMEQMDFGNTPFMHYTTSTFLLVTTPNARTVCRILMAVWLMGAAWQTVNSAIQKYRLYRLLKSCVPVEEERWQTLLKEYRERFGIRRVTLSRNYGLRSPITLGIFRHRIIIPAQDYTPMQMNMILEHEMNHIKNKDLLWKRCYLAVTAIHWFNPLVCLLAKKGIYLEEVICDRQSVENTAVFSLRDYGKFLADMEDNRIGDRAVSALCESRNIAVQRIRLLMNGKAKLMPGKCIFLACLILPVLCTSVLSHAVSAYATEWSIVHMCATKEPVKEEVTEGQMIYDVSDKPVAEKYLQLEEDCSKYEGMVEAQSRYFVFSAEMTEGSELGVSFFSEKKEDFRVGIKDLSTNQLLYQEAARGAYNYAVPADGSYAVYIENIQEYDLEVWVLWGYYPK
ncbi:MAG: M56 family metallopeptidase [Butyrivibrio sp.]|nr:M56 family metallopeptidase [Butyrivibrio sp.]